MTNFRFQKQFLRFKSLIKVIPVLFWFKILNSTFMRKVIFGAFKSIDEDGKITAGNSRLKSKLVHSFPVLYVQEADIPPFCAVVFGSCDSQTGPFQGLQSIP